MCLPLVSREDKNNGFLIVKILFFSAARRKIDEGKDK